MSKKTLNFIIIVSLTLLVGIGLIVQGFIVQSEVVRYVGAIMLAGALVAIVHKFSPPLYIKKQKKTKKKASQEKEESKESEMKEIETQDQDKTNKGDKDK